MQKPPTALTIAGSDSGGCAGVQADLRTFAALGVHGTSAITAVTAQNTRGVAAFEPVSGRLIASQIDAVLEDIGADAVKTGMLPTPDAIFVVAERLSAWGVNNLVVDPVMVATSGDRLMSEEAVQTLKEELFPVACLITPNLAEAGVLLGNSLESPEEIEAAGPSLLALGVTAVLVKGGHFAGTFPADDYLFINGKCLRLKAARISTSHTHGSGCTLAAAIAAWLAKGLALEEAVIQAKGFVTHAIENSYPVGSGPGPLGYLHGWWSLLEQEGYSEG